MTGRSWILVSLLLGIVLLPGNAAALTFEHPQRTGMALMLGSSYDPQPTIPFVQFSLMALYDYEQIFANPAPEALRFKLEGNLGLAEKERPRLLMSVNFFALYYLDGLRSRHLRPYLEAGAGLVYNDFQVDGQGLRINFNPQAGIGTEWKTDGGRSYYGALRAYHISNGHLYHANRGINALLLQLGVHF